MKASILNECSIIRLPYIATDLRIIVDLYDSLTSIKFNNNCIVCIDYIPLSVYSETGSRLFCTLEKREKDNIVVNFRTRQQSGLGISNILSRYLFNYDAIQGVKDAGLSGYRELIEILRFNLAQFSNVCEAIENKHELALCNKFSNVIDAAANNVSVDSLDNLITFIDSMQDNLITLAVFVFLTEYDAIRVKGSLSLFSNDDVSSFTEYYWIDDLHTVSVNTYNLHMLEELSKIDDSFKDSLTQGTDIWKFFNTKQSRINQQPSKMYDLHMIMANYELMYFKRNAHKNASQDLLYSLTEFVPILTKLTNVPNPILDDEEMLQMFLTEFEQKYRLSTNSNSAIVYQYKVFGSQAMKTSFKLLDDTNLSLVGVYVPCSVFDRYFSTLKIKPRDIDFLSKEYGDIQYSAYLAEAIFLSIYLKNSITNNIMLNEAVGSLSYSQVKKDNGGYKHIYSLNIFGNLGIEGELCGKFENTTDNKISLNSLLAYKAYFAAGKNIGNRVDRDFGVFLKDFNSLSIGGN